MAMAVAATSMSTKGGSSPAAYVVKPPPPPPGFQQKEGTSYDSYSGRSTRRSKEAAAGHRYHEEHQQQQQAALNGTVLLLRATAAAVAFVGVALVASCRHGDWMEFRRYPEYRYLLAASVVACVYSAAQAVRSFRRRLGAVSGGYGTTVVDFAGDQVVAYLLMTASSAALPITLRMRSAVINVFTDALVAAISLGFIAFAALALSAMLSGFRISAAAAAAQQPYYY